MTGQIARELASLILAVHVGVILFNVFGLVAIPVGAWRRWGFAHGPWWRLLHVGALGVVAAQALAGRACFLTIWQSELLSRSGTQPLIARWVDHLIYWPLPLWVFTVLYVMVLVYTLALLWLVPLRWRVRKLEAGAR